MAEWLKSARQELVIVKCGSSNALDIMCAVFIYLFRDSKSFYKFIFIFIIF